VAIFATDDENGHFHTLSGVMLGTYPFHDGHFTINALNFGASLGTPAADRLLLNLVIAAQKDSSAIYGLNLPDISGELDQLGIKD
jgi:hypothetical protein